MKTASLAAALLLCAACARTREPRVDAAVLQPDSAVTGQSDAADSSRIARLEAQARAAARTEGCTRDEQCRAAPVGSRPCGGPRTYVPFCAASTDTVALSTRLAELRQAEDSYNKRHGLMSTCEFRQPPAVMVDNGRCRVVSVTEREEVP